MPTGNVPGLSAPTPTMHTDSTRWRTSVAVPFGGAGAGASAATGSGAALGGGRTAGARLTSGGAGAGPGGAGSRRVQAARRSSARAVLRFMPREYHAVGYDEPMAHVLHRSALALALALALAACGVGPAGDEDLGQTAQLLETFPNEQPAFDYFRSKGLTGEQSAGIVGNLDVESGLDPTIAQSGGPGRGIAQWSVGARWDTTPGDNVKSYAAQQGKSAVSLQLQLDFIWFELTMFPGYGLTKLKATTTVSAATSSFATNYEGCGACSTATRIAYAQSALDRFGGKPVADAGSSSGDPVDACTVQTTGATGTCLTTAACAALGSHVSTPGFCPGADDVQCCTANAGGSASRDGGASSGGETPKGSSGAPTDDGGGGCAASRRAPPSGGGATAVLLGAALLLVTRRRDRDRDRAK